MSKIEYVSMAEFGRRVGVPRQRISKLVCDGKLSVDRFTNKLRLDVALKQYSVIKGIPFDDIVKKANNIEVKTHENKEETENLELNIFDDLKEEIEDKSSDIWSRNFFKSLRPEEILTVSEWAERYRYLPSGSSAVPGLWKTEMVPYMKEVMDSMCDTETEKIVIMAGSQLSKTETMLNGVGYHMHVKPCSIVYVLPTDGMAEEFSSSRIESLIANSDVLKSKMIKEEDDFLDGNKAKSKDTIKTKKFKGGYLYIGGATKNFLSSKSASIIMLDEIDRMSNIQGEGHPIGLAVQRAATKSYKKIVLTSTPTERGESAIEREYNLSDMRTYHVPCPECGVFNTWDFIPGKTIHFRQNENGSYIYGSAYQVCPEDNCGAIIREAGKAPSSILEKGKWVAKSTSRTKGYYINSLCSTFVTLDELCNEYCNALMAPNNDAMRQFVNLKLGLPYDRTEEETTRDISNKLRNLEGYTMQTVPNEVVVVTCGIDVQKDCFVFEFVGWGLGEESWSLLTRRVQADTLNSVEFNEFVKKITSTTFKRLDGKELKAESVCMDTGFNQNVMFKYLNTYTDKTIFKAIKGFASNAERRGSFILKKRVVSDYQALDVYNINSDEGKGEVVMYFNREKTEGLSTKGLCHFSKSEEIGNTEEFIKGFVSEVGYRDNNNVLRFRKVGTVRNEPLDCRVYALAALRILSQQDSTFLSKRKEGIDTAKVVVSKQRRFRQSFSERAY